MNRILVPTDFSTVALEAFKFAVQLTSQTGGELLLLHVIDVPVAYTTDLDGFDYTFDPRVVKAMNDKAESQFQVWKKKYGAEISHLQFHIANGSVTNLIESFIKKKKIDLVVMGTHGVSGAKEFFIGSTTEKIVRFAKVPVFSIRKSVKLASIKNIVMPTQLNLNETLFVNRIKDLQKFFHAKLQLVYINTPVNFRSDRLLKGLLSDYVKHYKLSNCEAHIVNDVYEQQGILSFANQTSGALIAMSTHGRRGLAHFFNLSIAEQVVNHVECPIWTYSIRK